MRDQRLVALGFDESFNVSRPLFVSSDDGGSTWLRRDLDQESVARSGTFEGATAIAAGPAGFVASGSTNDGPAIWFSPDGANWKRLPKDRKAFAASDEITAITATAQGFSMVGTSSLKNGGSSNHLVYWRSPDGVAWQRTAGPAIGLKPTLTGSVYAAGIVAIGKVIVISGGVSAQDGTDRLQRLQFWYSADSGKTFRTSTIRGEAATGYMYNNVLAKGNGKIVALAQGNGFDGSETGSWDGVVLEGDRSGRSWQAGSRVPAARASPRRWFTMASCLPPPSTSPRLVAATTGSSWSCRSRRTCDT
ncbi:sialidase family protein [Kribbella alba]|uniref:sialidase family protein n=1 Tax=Kribbella alba TaxID=190197 RepID=UPI0031D867F3